MELLGVECFCLPEWKLIIMTITLEIMSEFWSLNTVLIIAMIVCVWGQQFLLTKCFWGAMEPSRRSYWLLFHRSPFWRLWPAGSWGSWLTECSELEPTLYWPVSAEGFVDCSQWSDLLWEQKGLTFCFILTYPSLGVYLFFTMCLLVSVLFSDDLWGLGSWGWWLCQPCRWELLGLRATPVVMCSWDLWRVREELHNRMVT